MNLYEFLPSELNFVRKSLDKGEDFLIENRIETDILNGALENKGNYIFLKNIFNWLNPDGYSDHTFINLHRFVGSTIEHDLVKQIVTSDKNVPTVSAFSILAGVGRCGVKARVLADLLVVGGFDAGVITTGHHVVTYLNIDGYRILDSDLFTPGMVPFDSVTPLGLDNYIENDLNLDSIEHNTHFFLPRNRSYKSNTRLFRGVFPSSSLNSTRGYLDIISRRRLKDDFEKRIDVYPKELRIFQIASA